jgi:8-oxo-dGTP diphosphatase
MATTLHVLARAVIRDGDWFLLAQAHGTSNTFLPGGHTEIGEGLPNTVKRELLEECCMEVSVEQYLGVVEHEWMGADEHRNLEICHLFRLTSPLLTKAHSVTSTESHLHFEWVHVSQLEVRALKPPPLIKLLRDFDESAAWYASSLKEVC